MREEVTQPFGGNDGPGREVASAKALWREHASWVEGQQEASVTGSSDQGSEDARSEGRWGVYMMEDLSSV